SVPSSCGEELKILGSQTSKGCGDPPETPAPTAPETETDSTRPDVLPPLYDDINTLTREVFLFQLSFAHLMELYVHTHRRRTSHYQRLCTMFWRVPLLSIRHQRHRNRRVQ
ncbi:hypothetical protein GBAR_LOCUS26449, partial [Geodia barretti]